VIFSKILKSLPPVTNSMFLPRVREILEKISGRQNVEDTLVTVGDLVEAGVVEVSGPPSAPVLVPGPVVVPEPEVDLTPPPTPTGLAVAAGLTRLIIETDEPTYTAGHGHDRAILYGATYSGTGPLPTFANAVELKTFLGSITDYVTNTGTAWHIWVKWQSVDGVLSAPAGGTNGVTATTGKVGTSDLNDLIITSQKLAAGSVDALSKFGAGLEPVYNVATLPSASGYTGPKTVYNQADGKLYRYVAGAWTTAVPTTDLTGQVTNAQITDSAVTAAKIASGAINVFDKFAGGLEPVSAVGTLPSPSGYTGPKTVLLTTDNKLYRYTGSAWTVAVPTTDLTGQVTTAQITDNAVTTAKIVDAAISTAKFAAGIEPVSIAGTLPSPSGYTGPKTVLLTTDNKLYRYTGSAWTVAVPTTDLTGQVTTAQITDGAITQGKFSSGLEPVSVVAVLPSPTGYTGPKSVFLTTDNKLYRYTGTAFSVAVPTVDLTGQITTTQITDNAVTTAKVAANAITAGQIAANTITAGQIAANTITAGQIAANTITAGQIAAGTITATEIAASTITGAKIAAGTVTASNIAADTITANEIAASAITATEIATDAVTANKILAGSVTTAKIAANAITANEIATDAVTAGKILAGSVTTAKIAANAVTANEIATDAVTANKILAGSVTTAKIAAGAVTANEIAANTILAGNIAAGAVTANKFFVAPVEGASLSIDPNFADSTAWSLLSGTAGTFTTITDGVVGNNILRSASAAASVYGNARLIPLDATKVYRVRARVRRDATANGTLTIAVALQDSSGTNIAGDGTYWNHQAANAVTANTTFTTYTHTFGAGTAKTFPGTARTMKPVALLNTGGTAGYMEVQDFRIEEVIPGELIVDGAIVAGKIATDAVTANKIQAGAVVAGKLAANAIVAADGVIANGAITNALIGTAAVDTAKIADAAIVTAKIADANVTTAKIADANITTAKIADASITNAKINDLDAAKITAGTIAAARIAAGTITTDKLVTNAATVAATAFETVQTWTQAGGDFSSTATSVQKTSSTLASLTTTGNRVKTIMSVVFEGLAGTTGTLGFVGLVLQIDGADVGTGVVAYIPAMISSYANYKITLPIVHSAVLSAASHTFAVRFNFIPQTSSGGSVQMTAGSSISIRASIVVEENKV
jgi:hypothetical protein